MAVSMDSLSPPISAAFLYQIPKTTFCEIHEPPLSQIALHWSWPVMIILDPTGRHRQHRGSLYNSSLDWDLVGTPRWDSRLRHALAVEANFNALVVMVLILSLQFACSISARTIPGFIDLVRSPVTTLFHTVRWIDIWIATADAEVHVPILEMLPKFSRLRILAMRCNFPVQMPTLPSLTELELAGVFTSYASFVRFMSDLPALQTLALEKVIGVPTHQSNMSFCARRLILDFWPDPTSEWLRCISSYLRHLGDHLVYLQLNCTSNAQIISADGVSMLDYSQCIDLRHLRIGEAVRLNVLATSDVSVSPELEHLLSSVTPHCKLETLILEEETENISNPTPWSPLSQFAELMDGPRFATVREITFIVNGSPFRFQGSARLACEHFTPLLAASLPSRLARRVVCVDGEDPDEVWC
ncbi:hypothetical protein DFH06DRAFT_1138035 [Mycena polygramma]|nr:hypothetical protein DFH06DRAFT_1138035 [Mycena polygramma]